MVRSKDKVTNNSGDAAGVAVEFNPFSGPAIVFVGSTTESQREVWNAVQMGQDANLAYNEGLYLRFSGELNLPVLKAAIQKIVERHESLRSTFSPDGLNFYVSAFEAIQIQELDLSGDTARGEVRFRQELDEAVSSPFDLLKGPLFRASLLKMSSSTHILIFSAHHIVCDGWSFGVILKELGALYQGQVLPDAVKFSEYSIRQQERDTGSDLAYWMKALEKSVDPLELPLDRARPAQKTFRSAREDIVLDPQLIRDVKKLGAKYSSSFFATLFTAFQVLMVRLSGQSELIIGIASAGQAAEGATDLVGHCVNALPIRGELDLAAPFGEILKKTKKTVLDAQDRQNFTFGNLVRELKLPRNPARLPLVDVLFNLDQTIDPNGLGFKGLRVSYGSIARKFENFELFVNAVEDTIEVPGRMVLEVQYNSDLFDASSIRSYFECFAQLLKSLVENPSKGIGQLELLTAQQKKQVLIEFNQTITPFPPEESLPQKFMRQAASTPHAIAVECDESLTYAQLDQESTKLAQYLIAQGVRRGTRVGIMMERSASMMVGLLGILKAGASYIPMDPEYPSDRLATMLEVSDARFVLIHSHLRERHPAEFGRGSIKWLSWENFKGLSAQTTGTLPTLEPLDVAYVIFTSGSTGKPKGVEVYHRGLTNFLETMSQKPGLSARDVLVAVTTLSFDIAVLELFLPLCVGAKVVIASRDTVLDPIELAALLHRTGATVMQATPATWRMLLETSWADKRHPLRALCGGEALPQSLADQLLPKVNELWNMYGPTETTVWSTCMQVVEPGQGISIGKPIDNTQLFVLNEMGSPQPIGVSGELFIAGEGVAKGYLNREDLTAERFVPNPFAAAGNTEKRMYRTGDTAKWKPDGTVVCLGRNDGQVKVRGYRIELGEIETVLMSSNLIRDVAVIVREDSPGDQRLVAYFVAKTGASANRSADETRLRETAQGSLPAYMIPQHWVVMDSLPRTLNLKLDRKALPHPAQLTESLGTTTPAQSPKPESESEKLVYRLFEEVLKKQGFGIDDDFFESGGHSLLVTQLIARIKKQNAPAPTFRELFMMPTVRKLARWMDQRQSEKRVGGGAGQGLIPKRPDSSVAPMSLQQQRLWYMEQITPGLALYHLPAAFRFKGKLNLPVLRECWSAIFARHSALRTCFDIQDGYPVQKIAAVVECELPLLKCREEEVQVLADSDSMVPFDLQRAPLLRAKLFELGPEDHVLYFVVHHSIWDGWCFDLFLRELKELYEAKFENRAHRLVPLSVDYADYSVWHRQRIESKEVMAREKQYWLKRLSGKLPLLELPADHPRPEVMSFRGEMFEFAWHGDLLSRVTQFARAQGTTVQMVLLATYEILLQRLSGLNDILVGSPIQGRSRQEVEDVIGFFVNTLVLRNNIEGAMSFAEVLGQTRETFLDAYEYQDIPFETLVEELKPPRDMSRTPIYQAFFSYQDVTNRRTQIADLPMSQFHVKNHVCPTDIVFWVKVSETSIVGAIDYNSDLFDNSTIDRWHRFYREILEEGMAQPDRKVQEFRKDQREEITTPLKQDRESSEEYLTALWKELLRVDKVDRKDNFFNIGGHSLLSMQMLARIERETGQRLSPRIILLNSLAQVAAQLKMPAPHSKPKEGPSDSSRETAPMFFGTQPLFGVLHPVEKPAATGVLICAPLGQDYMRTHWILRQCATQLARAGYPTLRFDYTGCGDSAGETLSGGFAQWTKDTDQAAQHLKDLTGVTKVVFLAVRMGALMAAQANTPGLRVLWDPIEVGKKYFEELDELQHLTIKESASPERPMHECERLGFEYSPALRAELSALKLAKTPESTDRPRRLILSEQSTQGVHWNGLYYWQHSIIAGEVVRAIVETIKKEVSAI